MLLYLNIFAQFYCNNIAPKITTIFSDDVHFLHAFHLKFTINANIVYILVEASWQHSTCSSCALIITVNIFNNWYIALFTVVLTLIPTEQFNRTHFRLSTVNNFGKKWHTAICHLPNCSIFRGKQDCYKINNLIVAHWLNILSKRCGVK